MGSSLHYKDNHNINTKTKEQACGNQRDAQIVLDKLTETLKAGSMAVAGPVMSPWIQKKQLLIYYRVVIKEYPEVQQQRDGGYLHWLLHIH